MNISVVLPVYNRTSSLASSIESVFSQTLQPHEIIVVDDGSNAQTYDALKPYLNRIKYIRHPKNRGVSAARNTGTKYASGDFIAYLDSDDIWLPPKLRIQADALTSSSKLVCHTDEFWFKKDKWVNSGKKHLKYGGSVFCENLDKCRMSPSSLMIARTVFDRIKFWNEDLQVCEDYEFNLRLCADFDILYIPIKTVVKRALEENSLSSSIKHIEFERLKALCKLLNQNRLRHSLKASALREFDRKFDIVKRGMDKT